MVKAVYPGTFDPITRGHEDLFRRAARLYGEIVIGIASSSSKKPMFSLEERIEIAREALAEHRNVRIVPFSGLLVHFVAQHQAQVILRGVRSVADFEYEMQLAGMNRHMSPDVETVFMTPSEGVQYISSTLVREIATLGGDVTKFVSPSVKRRLDAKLAANLAKP